MGIERKDKLEKNAKLNHDLIRSGIFFLTNPNQSVEHSNEKAAIKVNSIVEQLIADEVKVFIKEYLRNNTVEQTDLWKKVDKTYQTFISKLVRIADALFKNDNRRFMELLRVTSTTQKSAVKLWDDLYEELMDVLFMRDPVPEFYMNFVKKLIHDPIISDEMEFFLSYFLKGPESVADVLKHSNLMVNQSRPKTPQSDNHQASNSSFQNTKQSQIPLEGNINKQRNDQQTDSQSKVQNFPELPVNRKVLSPNSSRLMNASKVSNNSKADGQVIDYNYSEHLLNQNQQMSVQGSNRGMSPKTSYFNGLDRQSNVYEPNQNENNHGQDINRYNAYVQKQPDRILTIKDINDLF